MGSSRIELTAAQRDRAVGVLLGAAAGDALGAGYEFNRPLAPDHPVGMIGGGLGPFAPGEWTDDTSMAIAIAEIASTGEDLRKEKPLDYLVERWEWWSRTAPDVGVQTRTVLSETAARGLCAQDRSRRIGGAAPIQRPDRRQRITDADLPRGAGLPR